MLKLDRTTKCLLAIIALFLGVLVFRPLLHVTPLASAESASQELQSQLTNLAESSASSSSGAVVGYRTVPVSAIKLKTNDRVRSLQIIDSAQSFIVQYDDRLEIYRVDDVRMLPASQYKKKTTRLAN